MEGVAQRNNRGEKEKWKRLNRTAEHLTKLKIQEHGKNLCWTYKKTTKETNFYM
jgi:hypothetical protein